MAVSTSTASRLPEISVEEIGDHFIPLVPGAKSLVTAGIWALTKTSHCNRVVMASPIQGPSRALHWRSSHRSDNLLNEVVPQEMHAACDLFTPEAFFRSPTDAGLNIHAISSRQMWSEGFFQEPFVPCEFPSSARAEATMSAFVNAWSLIPQPPSGDSVMSTQVLFARVRSPAAAATMSVSSRTTPTCFSRFSTVTGVRT